MTEKYEPTPEEIENAAKSLTPHQKEMSDIREEGFNIGQESITYEEYRLKEKTKAINERDNLKKILEEKIKEGRIDELTHLDWYDYGEYSLTERYLLPHIPEKEYETGSRIHYRGPDKDKFCVIFRAKDGKLYKHYTSDVHFHG